MTACSLESCTRIAQARGYCRACHKRLLRQGAIRLLESRRAPVGPRFWAKVGRVGTCWIWSAGRHDNGYGMFWLDGTTRLAHRVAYELLIGPIPDDLQLDHLRDLCGNKACVKVAADETGPAHLEPATPRENTLRGDGPSALNAVKTQCPVGHPYDDENTYRSGGKRACKECRREATRRWRARAAA